LRVLAHRPRTSFPTPPGPPRFAASDSASSWVACSADVMACSLSPIPRSQDRPTRSRDLKRDWAQAFPSRCTSSRAGAHPPTSTAPFHTAGRNSTYINPASELYVQQWPQTYLVGLFPLSCRVHSCTSRHGGSEWAEAYRPLPRFRLFEGWPVPLPCCTALYTRPGHIAYVEVVLRRKVPAT